MSNSNLVDVTILSPNCNKPRNKPITKITVHHTAGIMTAEGIGNTFKPSARQASCNYGIGNDGRVVMCVEEKNRSWCSSSGTNDHQAITIEVSNDRIGNPKGSDGWTVGDAAFSKLIELCADICKRNTIPKLVYDGTPNGSLTTHRMFAATACPGDYLLSKFLELCEKVNAKLNANSPEPKKIYTVQTGAFASRDNAEAFAKGLKSQGIDCFVAEKQT